MNSIAIFASAGRENRFQSRRIRQATLATARAVLARGGRVILHADATTLVPVALMAAERRQTRTMETSEQKPAPVLVFGEVEGDEFESMLLSSTPEHDTFESSEEPGERRPTLLEALSAFNTIQYVPRSDDGVRTLSRLLSQESVVGVFLVGDAERLSIAAHAGLAYHRETRTPLFSLFTGRFADDDAWTSVERSRSERGEWTVTLDGRPIESGEDRETAYQADEDATLAFNLESIVARVLGDSPEHL